MNAIRRGWGFTSSLLTGIIYRFEYEQPIDWSKPYIICANHTSNLDITAMSLLVKSDCCFMGKEELLKGFVTGLFFRSVDIPVNRESNISAFRAFKKAGEKLQQGISLIIFPEGLVADDYPPKLQSFKNGPFRLAIEHKIPVIPVSSLNTWKMLWDDGTKYGVKPGICRLLVHRPIEIGQLTMADVDDLKNRVRAIVGEKIE